MRWTLCICNFSVASRVTSPRVDYSGTSPSQFICDGSEIISSWGWGIQVCSLGSVSGSCKAGLKLAMFIRECFSGRKHFLCCRQGTVNPLNYIIFYFGKIHERYIKTIWNIHKIYHFWLGMVAHICNPSTGEVEVGDCKLRSGRIHG